MPVEEKDVEHIIEERDSPESPEPEIPQPLPSNQQEANEPEQKVRKEEAPQDQDIDMNLCVQENSGLQLKQRMVEVRRHKGNPPRLVWMAQAPARPPPSLSKSESRLSKRLLETSHVLYLKRLPKEGSPRVLVALKLKQGPIGFRGLVMFLKGELRVQR